MLIEIAKAAAIRGACFAAIWWIVSEGSITTGWLLVLPTIAAATLASLLLQEAGAWRINIRGAARFLPFFAWQSILGGIDVARRALHPRLPLDPGFLQVKLRLDPGPARVFLANTISLLPGTLSVAFDERQLHIHVLDRSAHQTARLREIEEHVAALFGMDLPDTSERPLSEESTGDGNADSC